jgi:hypothetical protein
MPFPALYLLLLMPCWQDINQMDNCDLCGRFVGCGGSFAMIFDFVKMEPSHDIARCKKCTETIEPAQSNARPYNKEMSQYQWVLTKKDF